MPVHHLNRPGQVPTLLPLVAASFFVAGAVQTQNQLTAGYRHITNSDCLGCHAYDAPRVGPAFKDVAKRYQDDPGAAEALAAKIKNGGAGNWGEVPMIPHPRLSDTELAGIVRWILSGEPPPQLETPAPAPAVVLPTAPAEEVTYKNLITVDGLPPITHLPPPPVPPDNPMTVEKVELGRKLFFDGRLSGNTRSSCFVCHSPQLGWGDGGGISRGYPGTRHWRNAQTILNSAYYNKIFWDGSVVSLEGQAHAAATGAVGGNVDEAMAEMRLRFVPEYVEAFRQVFGLKQPRVTYAWRAIAAFERTLVSNPKNVPYDRYIAGDEQALTASALRGMKLFHGKANCIQCHNSPLASDQKFYALGVPEHELVQSDPLAQITHRFEQYAKGASLDMYRKADVDHGLYYVTKNPVDKGKFRTPSLRELKYTGPYMHNGGFSTLEEVVAFYNQGGGQHPNKSPLIKPLQISAEEQADLVAFLEALSSDEPIVTAVPAMPDYAPLGPSVTEDDAQ
ncbi:cytochrome c peroxidase [Sedimenticola hydrogenitrophicus]|uniref:cytochrome c peroxidase n=1 Tax=Sedimenticola hydrogenitrophicus TaxID=2967975 RepID=UPI0023AFB56E|nr:cytochrome c peroxidase [Sedimenticola hydrogenitrophicus]